MPVWGFADLHAHPASHLGFGANERGEGGMFWGKPGLRLSDAERTTASDLPSCIADKHAGFDEDIIRHKTRQTIIGSLNQLTGHSHTSDGWPSFEGWPHALSITHQQMHVSWIHRAWQGGLRLMLASITDNQTLSMIWHRGFNLVGSQPQRDPEFDIESAKRQIQFIRSLAQANSSWMEIVETPTQARDSISNGKLALVLSLELDTLNAEQIIALKRETGIRHVTPIHLVDNRFGGAAVYENLFNSNNNYLNGQFYHVTGDSNLEFRLSRPQYLAVADLNSVQPKNIEDAEYRALGYENIPQGQGHKNIRGLVKTELQKLMAEGLLIDLAHMSDAAQGQAIELSEAFTYPMMNSHTGIRPDNQRAHSERSMRRSLAERMARQGGVIGLGTEGNYRGPQLFRQDRNTRSPVVRFKDEQREWLVSMQRQEATTPISRLHVNLRTGGDDLREESQVYAVIGFGSRGEREFPLNNGAKWGNNSTNSVSFDLPAGTQLSNISLFKLRYTSGRPDRFAQTDNWNIDEAQVDFETGGSTLVSQKGAPFFRFTGDRRSWSTSIQRTDSTRINRLEIVIRTGGDDLRGDNDNAFAFLELKDGRRWELDLNRRAKWGNNSLNTVVWTLPDSVRASDLQTFGIRTTFGGGFSGDNWNIDEIRVTIQGSRATLFRLVGQPLVRFMGEQSERLLYVADTTSGDTLAEHLRVTVKTGGDDLRTNSQAFAVVTLRSGRRLEFPINRGGNWGNGSTYKSILALPSGTRRFDITAVGIRYVSGKERSADTTDNWTVDSVIVEILSDPIANWIKEYLEALATMQNRGVALGTDMNGLAPQIPFSKQAVSYPLTATSRFAPRGNTVPSLGRCQAGDRIFDFTTDGIAHYGLLPDFIQALSQHRTAADRLSPMFSTAEDVIQMWERVENAARAISGGGSAPIGSAIRGWVWADQPSAVNYTPSSSYQHNSRGGINQINRLEVGQYQVILPELGTTGGMVHVSAYGGSHSCKVVRWGASGNTQQIWVNCFSADGRPADGRFVLLFYQESRSTPGSDAYLWADQPSNESYTANASYQWNSKGLANTVRRISPGRYQVTLPGLNVLGGTVMVTAYGTGNERCKVGGWRPSGNDTVVDVYGFDAAGNPADTRFTLSFIADVGLGDGTNASQPYGGFVWANESASTAYTPNATYQKNTAGGSNTISRTGTGSYVVRFPGLAPSNSTTALATAYGSSSDYCTIQGWGSDSNSGTNITVRCFNSTGVPVDSQFTLLYLTDDPI